MLGDDPPYLSVGTEVSAKYKGAFCEAKIRKVVRSVKCRVTYKQGLGTATVTDDQIKGTLRVGAIVEAKHNDKKDFVEATITKIQDCSQYTVVFDDGDITTLRRTALCLKSGRHFAESETLDQLPLTHPEHFGNPVIGGRRGRRSRQAQDDSSEEDDDPGINDSGSGSGSKEGNETEPEIGRVVCVEVVDKKKKDNWFPGLVVAPTAQDTVRIRVRDDYLVRSFKDARYYTVPKNETIEFTKELINKVENNALKVAVEKALLFLEKNELPPHWDRDSLFGNTVSSGNSDTDGDLDSDSSDNEPREEKDHFVAQLYKFMDDRGTPINNCPMIGTEDIDLYKLFKAVYKLGGYNRVTNQNQWKSITRKLGFSMQNNSSTHNLVKQAYKKFLHSFEDFYRKLGCTMVNHPRNSVRKPRPGRSLIRDKDRNTPVPTQLSSTSKPEKDEEDKKIEDDKKEKREVKRESPVKEEEILKVKKKEETEESASGHESDVNLEDEESSSSEKSQKSNARSTPSNGIGSKPKILVTKDENKKKIPEKKKPDPKRTERKDEKPNKEDETAKTRSKSIDIKGKSVVENRESKPLTKDDKKNPGKQKKVSDDDLKKRGRKRKETDLEKNRNSEERSTEPGPPVYNGPIEIGDRLKVYYGPTHDSKITYEAKVVDKEHDETLDLIYLVHYTGWNTRYDEWIKSSRVAYNFTQTQGKLKRTKAMSRPQTPSVNSSVSSRVARTPSGNQSRRRAQSVAPSSGQGLSKESKKEERDNNRDTNSATRSITSSPLTNSLRTKSPGSSSSNRSTRISRHIDSSLIELGRRTRRTSVQNDSMAISETETESCESDATEPEMQSRARVRSGLQEKNRREARRRAESRMKVEETSDGELEKESEEPRRGRRIRKTINKNQDLKSEPDSDEDPPKGRDFDLNQIRSELKGFDKAVKMEIALNEPVKEEKPTSSKQEVVEPIVPDLSLENKEISKIVSSAPIKQENLKSEIIPSDKTDDIYEFKEPEPFEFEVRNKRDSSSDKDKPKKRAIEEEIKSPKKRPKTFSGPGLRAENKVETLSDANDKRGTKVISKSDNEMTEEIFKDYGENYTYFNKNKLKNQNISNLKVVQAIVGASDSDGIVNDDKEKKVDTDDVSKKCSRLITTQNNPIQKLDGKNESNSDSEVKKKIKKISGKKVDNVVSKIDERDKEIAKYFPNYIASKMLQLNKSPSFTESAELDSNLAEDKNKIKFTSEEDKTIKKRKTPTISGKKPVVDNLEISQLASEKLIDSETSNKKEEINPKILEASSSLVTDLKDFTKAQKILPVQETIPVIEKKIPISESHKPPESPLLEKIDVKLPESVEIKPEVKTLDFNVTSPHPLPPILTPISARLPATSSIEEKLSAAAVFRSKIKDNKKDEEFEFKKSFKESIKKSEAITKKIKEDLKGKYEIDKKKLVDQNSFKREVVVPEREVRKDPLLAIIKQKDVEFKSKKEAESKVNILNKKDYMKNEDVWRKGEENSSSSSSSEMLIIKKETLINKVIKSTIDRDSFDSTDSSDSEKKLTIIDSEEYQDQKVVETNTTEVKLKATSFINSIEQPVKRSESYGLDNLFTSSSQATNKVTKIEDEKENMNSLLCEEEIPGSPTPGSEGIDNLEQRVSITPIVTTEIKNPIAVTYVDISYSSASTSSQFCNAMGLNSSAGCHGSLVSNIPAPAPVSSVQSPRPIQPPYEQPPLAPMAARRESNEAAPVMDNTPPTTPDSIISNLTTSSREERLVESSPTSEDNSKLNRDSSEAENDGNAKSGVLSEEDNNSLNILDRASKPVAKRPVEDIVSPKKRKRRKDSENTMSSSEKKSPRQGVKNTTRLTTGSDSDDTSETSSVFNTNPPASTALPISSIGNTAEMHNFLLRTPRLTKYNFCTELDPELDGNQRINVLQQRLSDLRKAYQQVKQELAGVERRKKKLKRREREAMKAAKAEMQQACS